MRLRVGSLTALLGLLALLTSLPLLLRQVTVLAQSPERQLAVFSSQTTYSVPLVIVNGQAYAGLVELLEPLGNVEAQPDGKKYKLRFTPPGGKSLEMQFQDNKDKGKIKGDSVKLPAPFFLLSGRGYVPLSFISELLSRSLSTQVRLNADARRLFIGGVAEPLSLELRKGTPSRLFISATSRMNPTIATEPGRIRFTFRREPVLVAGDRFAYDDPLITGATFSEHDGIAELVVTGSAPLMANFADDFKTIVVTAAPAPPPPPPAEPVAPVAQPPVATGPSAGQPRPPSGPRFFVLIDPSHGGAETGAVIAPNLLEKDVVLALARRVQHELASRGIAAGLLRTSDTAISLDQRALSANAARPALYVGLHASGTGRGVHVFTSLLSSEYVTPRDFLPWDRAQAAFLELSGSVAGSVAAELETRKLPNSTMAAPLRPMNNVAAPAFSIEIAPPADDVTAVAGSGYQDQVAQSIAAGIAAVRSKIPEVRP